MSEIVDCPNCGTEIPRVAEASLFHTACHSCLKAFSFDIESTGRTSQHETREYRGWEE